MYIYAEFRDAKLKSEMSDKGDFKFTGNIVVH